MNFFTPRVKRPYRRNRRPSEGVAIVASSEVLGKEPEVTGKITKRSRRRARNNGIHIN